MQNSLRKVRFLPLVSRTFRLRRKPCDATVRLFCPALMAANLFKTPVDLLTPLSLLIQQTLLDNSLSNLISHLRTQTTSLKHINTSIIISSQYADLCENT